MKYIKYRKGYKYQLAVDTVQQVDIFPEEPIYTPYIDLSTLGKLTIRQGYAWDGPSGPALDTPGAMRASLVHDVLYQLMREEFLPREARAQADKELYRIAREDGMNWLRAKYFYFAVSKFAANRAHPNQKRRVWTAP